MSKNEAPKPGTVFTTRGHEIMAISAILYIIVFCLSGLLIYIRICLRSSFRANGIFALLAMIPTSLYFVTTLVTNDDFHWNRHQSDIPPSVLKNGFILAFTSEIFFTTALTLTKLSLMMSIQRRMSKASALWRGFTKFFVVIVAIQGAISCFLVAFQCDHPQYFWILSKRQQCSSNKYHLIAGIMNIITDLIVIMLPIPSILSLKGPKVIVILFLFFLGTISITAGITRTYFLSRPLQTLNKDFTWSYYPIWITSALALYLGMICAIIPLTLPFFTKFLPTIFPPAPAPPNLSFLPTSNDEQTLSNSNASSSSVRGRKQSTISGGHSSGDEELLDFDFQFEKVGRAGVTTATAESTSHRPVQLCEEDREYIKITQQTVVQISRVGEV